MTPTASLVIDSITSIEDLKTCSPNLMPFHIGYSGQAPISTYLRVQVANETVGAPPKPELTTDATSISSDARIISIQEENSIQTAPMPTDAVVASSPTPTKCITNTTTRFVSSFRGREIHGLKVELPEGYGGLILKTEGTVDENPQSEFDAQQKSRTKPRANRKLGGKGKGVSASKGRVTRSTRRNDVDNDVEIMDVDQDVEGGGEGEIESLDETIVRTLVPSSQFSSFVLWHADIPVDGGKDEYFRSLTEWARLAHEIHRTDT